MLASYGPLTLVNLHMSSLQQLRGLWVTASLEAFIRPSVTSCTSYGPSSIVCAVLSPDDARHGLCYVPHISRPTDRLTAQHGTPIPHAKGGHPPTLPKRLRGRGGGGRVRG